MADALLLAAPFLGLLFAALTHIGLMRVFRAGVVPGAFVGVLAGVAASLLVPLAVPAGGAGEVLANAILALVLGYGYLHFVNLGSTARRLRLLHELASAPDGLSAEELLTRYNGAEVVARRLERLIGGGHVDFDGRRYRLNPSPMRALAVCFVVLKRLIYGSRGHERI
ncbi:MAG TPA: hypothetical protein PKB11_10470 [Desulfovibrio sp.]|uniref:hypothetical protein n=1 Tax=Desulfovibrio sp. TaxID=885 RepID=UPI002B792AA9|nr:hypothetical protein [Desulfovibrio sp.]HMM39167.1 hypothetical protein [Desulfovibrio sp.]